MQNTYKLFTQTHNTDWKQHITPMFTACGAGVKFFIRVIIGLIESN